MPGLPLGTAVSARERVLLGRVPDLFERDLLEQSVTERLARAAFAAALVLAGNPAGVLMSGSSDSAISLHDVTWAYGGNPAVQHLSGAFARGSSLSNASIPAS